MNLSNRMKEIIKLVPKNSILADIGTDHGYIPIYLIENNICKKVIASDLNRGPLEIIKENVESRGLDNIDIRLGNGLEAIKEYEVDTVVIAGMGGVLIKEILDENKNKSDTIVNFILQPNTASDVLREYLLKNNFIIKDEKLVKDENIYYEIILAEKGKQILPACEFFEIGEKLVENQDPLLGEFLDYKIAQNNKILDKIKDLEGAEVEEKRDLIYRKLVYFKEVYASVKG